MQRQQIGFTLIEMMVVVALIAILAAIALPAYNGYVNRSKIKTAQADLVALSLNVENEYQRRLAYSTTVLGTTNLVMGAYEGWRPASHSNDFSFAKSVATTTTYTLTATGTAGGVKGCILSINQAGVRELKACSYSTNGEWL